MFNIVKIGEERVPMLSMASVDVYYRQIFHEDAIKLQSAKDFDEGALIVFLEKMGFVMAKFAETKDRKSMLKLNEDNFLEWLDHFDRVDYLNALADIRATYEGQMLTDADAKKNNAEQNGVRPRRFSCSVPSSLGFPLTIWTAWSTEQLST